MAGFFDVVEVSVKNLRRAGIRTFLTLIGVVIGIAAIVSLLSIGQGLGVSIEKQFEQLGTNTIFVIPGSGMSGTSTPVRLTGNDLSRIESTKGIDDIAPIYVKSAVMEFNNQRVSVSIYGIEWSKGYIFDNTGYMDVADGRMVSKNDSLGIIIGDSLAKDTFDRELNVRKQILLNGVTYKVVGILKKQSGSMGSGAPSTGSTIYMSLEALERMFPNEVFYPSIVFAKTFTKDDVAYAADKIKSDLERKYGEKSVNVMSSDQILEQINMVLGIVTLFLAGVGGISLIVGGIGIMNAMITSVLERTKEIGIMKALGASDNKVLSIFLLEASFIGGIGGVFGIIIGYLLSYIVSVVGNAMNFPLTAVFSLEITLGALFFAMFIGMLSGLLPAFRAARLDPVAALRYE